MTSPSKFVRTFGDSSPMFKQSTGNLGWLILLSAMLVMAFGTAFAAGTTGTALQGAYQTLDELVNGYGKQLLTVVGFAIALITYMAANATSIIMKFIGFCIFGGAGLTAAITVMGALI